MQAAKAPYNYACRHVHVIVTTRGSRECDIRFHAARLESLRLPRGSYLQSILHMDALLDEASTSDADERELLDAAHSDLYWGRVVSRRPLKLPLPTNALADQGDDM